MDVLTLAGVSYLWRVSVWRALRRGSTQASCERSCPACTKATQSATEYVAVAVARVVNRGAEAGAAETRPHARVAEVRAVKIAVEAVARSKARVV